MPRPKPKVPKPKRTPPKGGSAITSAPQVRSEFPTVSMPLMVAVNRIEEVQIGGREGKSEFWVRRCFINLHKIQYLEIQTHRHIPIKVPRGETSVKNMTLTSCTKVVFSDAWDSGEDSILILEDLSNILPILWD